jgi:signal peptidase II
VTATRRWSLVGIAVAAVLALDQLTKWWAVRRLCGFPYCPDQLPSIDRAIDVVWTLRFNYAENTGMAFSRGTGQGRIIGLVVVLIVVALLVVARRLRSTTQLVLVGVVVGGALGNLVDRLFRADGAFLSGGVVDFVDLQWWPIFNVADAAVVVGGIALALTGLREEPEAVAERAEAEAEAAVEAEPGAGAGADAEAAAQGDAGAAAGTAGSGAEPADDREAGAGAGAG